MKRLTLTFGLLALAAVLAACSGASAQAEQPSSPAGSPSGATVAVVAKDLKFVTPAVAVKAGTAFAIDFDNQDGAPHNIAISDASAAPRSSRATSCRARRSATRSRRSPPARTPSSARSIPT